jgi:hypothetical protein
LPYNDEMTRGHPQAPAYSMDTTPVTPHISISIMSQ